MFPGERRGGRLSPRVSAGEKAVFRLRGSGSSLQKNLGAPSPSERSAGGGVQLQARTRGGGVAHHMPERRLHHGNHTGDDRGPSEINIYTTAYRNRIFDQIFHFI